MAETRTERAVVEELVELLEQYGPAIVRLADHFDELKAKGVTGAAARRAREQPQDEEGDVLGGVVDLLSGALKTKIRGAVAQRRRAR